MGFSPSFSFKSPLSLAAHIHSRFFNRRALSCGALQLLGLSAGHESMNATIHFFVAGAPHGGFPIRKVLAHGYIPGTRFAALRHVKAGLAELLLLAVRPIRQDLANQ